MSKRKFECELSAQSIKGLIREITEYNQSLNQKIELFTKRVAEKVRAYAAGGFVGAIYEDLLEDHDPGVPKVDVTIKPDGNLALVIADGKAAVWCEFGAGVYYNGSPGASPHPMGAELGFTIGGFGEGNGTRAVWGFYDENRELHLTHGTPASMPMYKALVRVCDDISSIAREVFG